MWFLYQIATILALVFAGPYLLLRRGGHYLESLPGRLGRDRRTATDSPLWIHAVSVGEVTVATTLIRALPRDMSLLVTTITPTGQQRARRAAGGRAIVAYLPFDLGFAVESFLRRYHPRALILVEGDLWPLLLSRTKRRGMPVFVINGRISDRSFRHLARLRWLVRPLFGPVDHFGVQSPEDRERLLALGVRPQQVTVTGNLKFETPSPRVDGVLLQTLRSRAGGRPMLVAGSTMQDEESEVLAAFARIGGGRRAMLVVAPRHPERWPEVEKLIHRAGLEVERRSRLAETAGRPDVLLLDSLGELAGIYGSAAGCFIGGTLVPTGGHNPLEAARHGVAIAVGPSMENFREIAAAFDAADAWCRVPGAEELAETWNRWLEDPAGAAELGARGARLIQENRGALERTLRMLGPVLEAECSAGRASAHLPI